MFVYIVNLQCLKDEMVYVGVFACLQLDMYHEISFLKEEMKLYQVMLVVALLTTFQDPRLRLDIFKT